MIHGIGACMVVIFSAVTLSLIFFDEKKEDKFGIHYLNIIFTAIVALAHTLVLVQVYNRYGTGILAIFQKPKANVNRSPDNQDTKKESESFVPANN